MGDASRDMRFSSTLARGLAVLRAFRPSDTGLGNQTISERTGIPKPTVYRLTKTLCADGYLTQERRNDVYRLGPAALALGQVAAASFPFVAQAAPVMQALADDTGVLTGIAIQDEGRMLMCATWLPEGSAADWLDIGYRMPIAGSSSGRAYLAALSQERFAALEAQMPTAEGTGLADTRRAAAFELKAGGFTCTTGEARYSKAINAVAVPFCPAGMPEPVAFLAGAASGDLSEARTRTVIGPALAKAVGALDG